MDLMNTPILETKFALNKAGKKEVKRRGKERVLEALVSTYLNAILPSIDEQQQFLFIHQVWLEFLCYLSGRERRLVCCFYSVCCTCFNSFSLSEVLDADMGQIHGETY